jgi:hypothetical protein
MLASGPSTEPIVQFSFSYKILYQFLISLARANFPGNITRFFSMFNNFKKFSCIALGYGLDDQLFESLQGLGIFLFTTVSKLALGATHPLI